MERINKHGLGIVLVGGVIIISTNFLFSSNPFFNINFFTIPKTLMLMFVLNAIMKLGYYFLNQKKKD